MAQSNEFMTLRELIVSDKLLGPMQRFLQLEASSSSLLILATVGALVWANAWEPSSYQHFWHIPLAFCLGEHCHPHSLVHWVNDGLMVLFFFVVGLEIKREVLVGELCSLKAALLPVVAAVGGMLVPGLIYVGFNLGSPSLSGWAIPMATDIAFALGAVAIFGRGLPVGLRIFLAAFAIADDLGAVLIIAIFYTGQINLVALWSGVLILGFMGLLNFFRVTLVLPYVLLGFLLWVAVFNSGVHATIAGVAAALTIPVKGKFDYSFFLRKVQDIMDRAEKPNMDVCSWFSIFMNSGYYHTVHSMRTACRHAETPLQRMEHTLHPWVAFGILPLFALANAGLDLSGITLANVFTDPVTLGVTLGLLVGKPLGITLFAALGVRMGLASLPPGVDWLQFLGVAILGGIGFTMSLFVSGLSFSQLELINASKLGILIGSFASAVLGAGVLFWSKQRQRMGSRSFNQEQEASVG